MWPEGVTDSVAAKMRAVSAGTLREDGRMQRMCPHGVLHPVGDIHHGFVPSNERERHTGQCCQESCCAQWS